MKSSLYPDLRELGILDDSGREKKEDKIPYGDDKNKDGEKGRQRSKYCHVGSSLHSNYHRNSWYY